MFLVNRVFVPCAVGPVFARVVGELWAADPSSVQGPVKQNASTGEQSEAPKPRWKPGQEQNPGPENQDGQHMLEQPRGYFLKKRGCFDENGENDEFAVYPPKTRVWLLRPPKTPLMTKMAGVTQEKAYGLEKAGFVLP